VGGGAPIPLLLPQTSTVMFGGGMAATTSTQPPVLRNTGDCANVFRNTGTWGLETWRRANARLPVAWRAIRGIWEALA
jgi:hypothetical protein